jgi:hypothetical protein
VWVTVISGGRRPAILRRGPALALFAVAAVLAVVSLPGGHRAVSKLVPRAQPAAPGPAGVAAALRYPLGCLSVTLDNRYATASLDRASPCWRYGVYVTAILRRVEGVWRLVLYARANRCPPRSLPAAVRAQVAVCARAGRS